MCLFTKQILPIKTHNYITVYKVVGVKRYSKHGRYRYYTPVMKKEISLYQPIVATGRKTPRYLQHRYLYFNKFMLQYRLLCCELKDRKPEAVIYSVEDGYIHCCSSIEYAKKWVKKNSTLFPHKKWAIIKCIVNPNTLYFRSFNGEELCVRSLTPREVVLHG